MDDTYLDRVLVGGRERREIVIADHDPAWAERFGLAEAGYELRVREEGHRMYRTPERDVHVHVWPSGSPNIGAHLAFRDRLRSSPEDRAAYEALKRSLASRDWPDMNHYAEAKGPLIREILSRSRD